MNPYPEDWNHASDLPDALVEAIREGDCGWLQTAILVSWLLANILVCNDDAVERVNLAETLCDKLLQTARAGYTTEARH